MEIISKIKNDYQTKYIPGHVGIWYNATADQLAGAVEPIHLIKLQPDYVKSRIRKAVRESSPPFTNTKWSFLESTDVV